MQPSYFTEMYENLTPSYQEISETRSAIKKILQKYFFLGSQDFLGQTNSLFVMFGVDYYLPQQEHCVSKTLLYVTCFEILGRKLSKTHRVPGTVHAQQSFDSFI